MLVPKHTRAIGGPGLSRDWPGPDSHERWLPYAVMEYENFRVSTEATSCDKGRKGGIIMWAGPNDDGEFLSEVSAFSELIVTCLPGTLMRR